MFLIPLESIKEIDNKVVWLEHGKIIMMGSAKKVCKSYYDKQLKEN